MIFVNSIKVYPCSISLSVGKWFYDIKAEVLPTNADSKDVVWYSDNPNIASVNSNNGYIYGNCSGKAKIFAVAKDGSGVFGMSDVSVTNIPVSYVSISPKQKTLSVNETTKLNATIFPNNASDKTIIWTSCDTSIATVGTYTGVVTGKRKGRVTITATTLSGNKIDTCKITVDSREKVEVKKSIDGDYNIIEFPNGKKWNCINVDVINQGPLAYEDPLWSLYNENIYVTKVVDSNIVYYYEPLKEYTDEEIKVIYTIDPHGLAAYVKTYGSYLFGTDSNVQIGMQKTLDYKDRIFYLLFNRRPRYYRRSIDGVWYETTDKSDPLEVMSESEFIFGKHTVYDDFTLRQYFNFIIDIVAWELGCPMLTEISFVNQISALLKFYSLSRSVGEPMLRGDFNGFVSSVVSGSVDEALGSEFISMSSNKTSNYSLSWVSDLTTFLSNMEALASTFDNGPHFYKEVFTFCDSDLDYCIMIQNSNNEYISISDLNNAIE